MAAIVGRKGSVVAYVGENETLTSADKLPHVTGFTPPSSEAEEIDVTDFDSDGKEFETGEIDYGTLEITQYLNTDEYETMQDRVDEGKNVYFMFFVKNKAGEIAVGRQGKGVVKTVTLEGTERGSAITVKTSIKVSGAVTKVIEEPTEESVG